MSYAHTLQNAFAESQSTIKRDDDTVVAENALNAGHYPVCVYYDIHCPITDGYLFSKLGILKVFKTGLEAVEFLSVENNYDHSPFLYGWKLSTCVRPIEIGNEDEIPF